MENLDLTYDDYLAHYGVKGMKWGLRKRRDSSSGRSSKSGSSKSTSESNKHEKTKKIAKGAAAAAVVAGGVALAYANRNNPSVRRGLSSVAKISNQMKNKTVDSVYDVKLKRMAKRGQKMNANSPFAGKNIYCLLYTSPSPRD